MKVTKIKPSHTKLIKEFKEEIAANDQAIKMLSLDSQKRKERMFDLACGGDQKLLNSALLNDECTELISFDDEDDMTLFKIKDVKNQLVRTDRIELAAKMRDIEKQLINIRKTK